MKQNDILSLIESDETMMTALRRAEGLGLADWVIGAGFIRDRVWDYLHAYSGQQTSKGDIDLVYYDVDRTDQAGDRKLSGKLRRETSRRWEVVNQAYAHTWNNQLPYASLEDALSHWPETATAIGVSLENTKLGLLAPYGIGDLVNLVVRPTSRGDIARVRERAGQKEWVTRWPRLKVEL